jgi:phosphoribosylformimino-5-aminoimidazole carboxamide ribotide isomerase
VRLRRGDFAVETRYDVDPLTVARRYEAEGAPWVHVVDLDAARTGEPAHLSTLAAVAAAISVPVQAGGGVRSAAAAAALLDAGAARVVVGTAAVEQPELVPELCGRHPGRVALGLDVRGREVAVRGWEAGTGEDVVDVAGRFASVGVAALIVTQISQDGTLEGPDLEGLALLLGSSDLPLVASGGVGTLDDLRALNMLEADGRRLVGAIVGRALYENRFTVAEAVEAIA